MSNYHQKKLSLIAFTALWIAIFIIAIAQLAKPPEASAKGFDICEYHYLGREFALSKKKAAECQPKWEEMTRLHILELVEIEINRIENIRSYDSVCDLDGLPEDECKI